MNTHWHADHVGGNGLLQATGAGIAASAPDWQVLRTPGHTPYPGHPSLWQPEERLLVVGDALLDYDVGWVNLSLDGPEAAATAVGLVR